MNNQYTLSFSRATDGEYTCLPFSFEATVRQPAAAVWNEWLQTLSDHERSWLWPTQYSRPTVDAFPPRAGGVITLTYQMPNPYDLAAPPRHLVYDFDIVDYSADGMYLDYKEGATHPFLGGGRVSVKAIDEHTCLFTWAGMYKHLSERKSRQAAGDIFAHYFNMFFTALAQNIRNNIGY